MNADERLGTLIAWWRAHNADLLAGCEGGNAYALRTNALLFAALEDPADERLTAAEIALVELEADWGGK